jgi:hypothetical protein
MGTLGNGNGGSWPPEGGGSPDDRPDVPPEWGSVVIPDDPAELADEAAEVRRQLRRQLRGRRWRKRLHLPVRPLRAGDDGAAMGVALMIVSIAVLATMVSLFAIAWPGRPPPRPAPSEAGAAPPTGTAASPADLPDVPLTAADGSPVRLRDSLPAVVLLVDDCACTALFADTASAVAGVDPTIAVVTVGRGSVAPPAPAARAVVAEDLKGALWVKLGVPMGTGRAAAVLADVTGKVVAVVPAVSSVDDFKGQLFKLRR